MSEAEREAAALAEIVRLYDPPRTLHEIGEALGYCSEMIRVIEARAIAKLRRRANAALVGEMLDTMSSRSSRYASTPHD
jgi:DNA-directed RNA polymerase sigma subunit (sigma70/sigma32)